MSSHPVLQRKRKLSQSGHSTRAQKRQATMAAQPTPQGNTAGSPEPSTSFAREEETLLELFKHIIKILKDAKAFESSPTFFVVYAWKNTKKLAGIEAHDEISDYFIKASRMAGCRMRCDQDPEVREILPEQLCLLPDMKNAQSRSVELVVLCGSPLMAHYMDKPTSAGYHDAMVDTISAAYNGGRHSDARILAAVEGVFYDYNARQDEDIHHVETELAFLDARQQLGDNKCILPFFLTQGLRHGPLGKFTPDNSKNRTELKGEVKGKKKYLCYLGLWQKVARFDGLNDDEAKGRTPALIQRLEIVFDKAADKLKDFDDHQDFLRLYRYDLDQEFQEWSSHRVLVDVRSALDKGYAKKQLRTVSNKDLELNDYHVELAAVEAAGGLELSMPLSSSSGDGIPDFFQPIALKDGDFHHPKRILIKGVPGSGKSTLSRQILDMYTRETRGCFLWVILVPLRECRGKANLAEFFGSKHFSDRDQAEKEKLSQALESQLHKDKTRTLLILDGLDEVQGTEDMLRQLDSFENIIATCQPSKMKASLAFDVTLEARGFDTPTINRYLNDFGDSEVRSGIQRLLEESSAMFELVRVPIHLDLLCSTWKTLRPRLGPDGIPTTTMLYDAMVQKLWHKDINSANGRDLHVSVDLFEDMEIQTLRQCLGELALEVTGQGDDFGDREIGRVVMRPALSPKETGHLTKALTSGSFLLQSDTAGVRSYSFTHSTVREFLAAQRLAQNPQSLDNYLKQHRYAASYEGIWRFVAGLLQLEAEAGGAAGNAALCAFFNKISALPVALLGFSHPRLVAGCLSQVSTDLPLRCGLEDDLSQWLLWECRLTGSSRLALEADYPTRALDNALRTGSALEINMLLQSMFYVRLPDEILKTIYLLLSSDLDPIIRSKAYEVLRQHCPPPDPLMSEVEESTLEQHYLGQWGDG